MNFYARMLPRALRDSANASFRERRISSAFGHKGETGRRFSKVVGAVLEADVNFIFLNFSYGLRRQDVWNRIRRR